MRRGLDYLAASPEVDPARIGVTGLSGGGWQTVLLAALDPRVAVSVEVAGVGSRESNLTAPGDTYEIEEDAPDLMQGFDYPELIALRAPKPTQPRVQASVLVERTNFDMLHTQSPRLPCSSNRDMESAAVLTASKIKSSSARGARVNT